MVKVFAVGEPDGVASRSQAAGAAASAGPGPMALDVSTGRAEKISGVRSEHRDIVAGRWNEGMRTEVSVEPISRESAVDQLERRLQEDILGGRYAVGTLLPPERELAARYGVNRNTLKHAFVRLVQVGLVETRHGVGTRVRDFHRLGSADLLPALGTVSRITCGARS